MANTIADQVVPNDSWLDVATATGIVAGTALIIQNKGGYPVIMWIGATAPAITAGDGPVIFEASSGGPSTVTVSAGESKVWLRSGGGKDSLVNIQDNT